MDLTSLLGGGGGGGGGSDKNQAAASTATSGHVVQRGDGGAEKSNIMPFVVLILGVAALGALVTLLVKIAK